MILGIILGLLIGFYARDIRDKVTKTYEYWKAKIENPAGITRPEPYLAAPTNSQAGATRPLSPAEVRERDAIARNARV